MVSLATLLTKVQHEIRGMYGNNVKQLLIKTVRSDELNAGVAGATGQVMKVQELLQITRSEQKMALAQSKARDAQRRNLVRRLHTWRSKMPGLKTRVTEDVGGARYAFCLYLAALLLGLTAARRRGIGVALFQSMAPLREVCVGIKTELAGLTPNIAEESSAYQ